MSSNKQEQVFSKRCRVSRYDMLCWMQDLNKYMDQHDLEEIKFSKLPDELQNWRCYTRALKLNFVVKVRKVDYYSYTFKISNKGLQRLQKFKR